MDYVASALTLLRLALFSQATRRARLGGWWTGHAAALAWMVLGIMWDSPPIIVMNVIYAILNIRGHLRERKT